jgi:hypothetical protein
MEAVDEAPRQFRRKRVQPGIAQQVENGGDDAAAFRLRRDGLGHEKFARFLVRFNDGKRQGIAEGRHEIGGGGYFSIEFRQVGKAANAAQGRWLAHGMHS